MTMTFHSKKCELKCGNKLPKDPYVVIIEGEVTGMTICDECAKLLQIIGEKMAERLNDESL